MQQTSLLEISLTLIVIILGMILMIAQLPDSIVLYKPNLVILVLFYAGLYMPDKTNIWLAWILGLLIDGLDGFVLGNHALQFALLATICNVFQTRIRASSISQQTFTLLLLILLMMLIEFGLRYIIKQPIPHRQFWTPAITTAIIWPLFYLFLSSIRRKIYTITSN